MTTFTVDINDIIVEVTIDEDHIDVSIVEDILDVDIQIYEDVFEVDIVEENLSVDIVDDVIEIIIDDCCIITGGGGESHIEEFAHNNPDIVVGDLVYMDSLVYNKVNVATDNRSPRPIIGMVSSISSSSIVKVILWGKVKINDALPPSSKLYISPIGKLSINIPINEFVQYIGSIINDDEILLAPEPLRVKRLEI